MAVDQEHNRVPPRPRTLRTIKGARLELARLYIQAKAGEIEPNLAGRLAHILYVLITTSRDHEMAERLTEIETRLAKASGYARPEARL
jgi:hypothetical protein